MRRCLESVPRGCYRAQVKTTAEPAIEIDAIVRTAVADTPGLTLIRLTTISSIGASSQARGAVDLGAQALPVGCGIAQSMGQSQIGT